MISIKIGNSYSQITGLLPDQFQALKKHLSFVSNPDAYFYGGIKYRRSLLSTRGDFPTGLLTRVKRFFKHYKIQEQYSDLYYGLTLLLEGKELNLPYKPYEWQTEAMKQVTVHHRGILTAPTGTGKSTLIALIIAHRNVKTLVVVPTLEIKKQLTESLLEAFGSLQNIYVENIDSPVIQTLTGIGQLIIDEAQHVASKTYQNLNKKQWTGIYFRYLLTATPFRNIKDEQLLFEGIAGDVIYRLTYKQAVSKKYIVPIEAFFIDLPTKPVEGFTWRQVYDELVVNNKHRNAEIGKLMQALNNAMIPCLCLVKEIAHGHNIPTSTYFVTGQDEESRVHIKEFNQGQIKALIATTGIMGEGIDSKPAEYVIIAGLGKAKSAFMQAVGRAVRNYPGKETAKVILFRDKSHKYTLRHFNTQKKILKEEYEIVPIKFDL